MAARICSVGVWGVGVAGSLALAVGCSEEPTSAVPQKAESQVAVAKESPPTPPTLRPGAPRDHMAALNQRLSQGVTPDNNAAVLILRAMGPGEILSEIRQRYFQMLGITPLPEQGQYLVAYDQYVERSRRTALGSGSSDADRQRELVEIDLACRQPWSPEVLPTVAAWLQASEQPLALIIEATNRPRRYDPLISVGDPPMIVDALLPMVQAHRRAARALTARAMLKLGAGNVPEAWQDLLACHRLARLTGEGRLLIEMLVATAIDGVACTADQALLAHGNLTADQARHMYNDLQSLPPLTSVVDAVDMGERYMFHDCAQTVADRGVGQISKIADMLTGSDSGQSNATMDDLSRLNAVKINANLIMQMGNLWYDRLVAAVGQTMWTQRSAAIAQLEAELSELCERTADGSLFKQAVASGSSDAASEQVGRMLIALLLPTTGAATQAEVRATETLEVVKLGFVLAAYRAENGRYPAQLSELTPKGLAQTPLDIFSGMPLIYQPRPNGYVLYSVGANGKDDGGLTYDDRAKTGGADQDYDDLVVQVPLKSR